MRTTGEAGLRLIKKYEGYSSKVYLCPANVPTIGFGSTWDAEGNKITLEHPEITEEVAESYLKRELEHIEECLSRLIKVYITQGQFDALVSFTYNLGSGNLQASTLRQKLNRRDYEGAALEFPKWRKAGGRVLRGLKIRRAEEMKLFNGETNG